MDATTEESLGLGFGFGICFEQAKKSTHPSDTYTGIRPYPTKMPHNGLPLKA